MQKIIHQRQFQVCLALLAADALVFSLVDPARASATWLIAGYILFGLTLFAVVNLLATTLKSYGDHTYRRGKRLLFYSAAISIGLVGLQSVGQLTVKDVVTLLPFAVIAYLYFGYGKKLATQTS